MDHTAEVSMDDSKTDNMLTGHFAGRQYDDRAIWGQNEEGCVAVSLVSPVLEVWCRM